MDLSGRSAERDDFPDFSEALLAYTGMTADELRERTNACGDADLREKLGLPMDGTDPGGRVVTQVLRDLPPGISDSVWDQVLHLEHETRSATEFPEELRRLTHEIRPPGI